MLTEPLRRKYDHLDLAYGPTDLARFVFVLFLYPDVVGYVLDNPFQQFHLRCAILLQKYNFIYDFPHLTPFRPPVIGVF